MSRFHNRQAARALTRYYGTSLQATTLAGVLVGINFFSKARLCIRAAVDATYVYTLNANQRFA